MNDFGESLTFAGVSATPNIATRIYDRLRDLVAWSLAWTYGGGEGTWSAQPFPSDPDAALPNDLYFH